MSSDTPARPTLLYSLYCGASALIAPFAWRKVAAKLRNYGLPEKRVRERLGHASLPRPSGRLIWFHAASVGESLSVLTLIKRMGEQAPEAEFLITSGTPTSAELIAKRMPPRCRHQFPPLDTAAAVDRFLAHWRPDLGVFVESELWPQMLVRARKGGCPLVLLNARLSDRSVEGWKKRPETARYILDQFDLLVTQNQKTAANLQAMGAAAGRIRPGSNLKAASAPLPVDPDSLGKVRGNIGARPVWVASSTHEGEEEIVLQAHKLLLKQHPDLCLLLAPRHPERGSTVETLVKDAGLSCARRSKGVMPGTATQVYLADTLGEVGTWYALCPLVFLGGSLREIGGHNPFEPMQAGAAVITGTGHYNFAETYAELTAAGAAAEVRSAADLADQVAQWLEQPETFQAARDAAGQFISRQSDQLDKTVDALLALLPARRP
ncbi:3-deoxy-D-manno-octulosonic acid transferase [Leisingera methylohalidivorans]|uniref:3-deoxy-D-manno-octulosonic acid transferase n=1 Tax=Leisingera methylohalidivorans DSM 14336 TaxID=999552 RepID=V9VVG8_9RHOB|nr:3-deoxy-D-manno-octulosonic acid transferase [Leisingera methylohalidivorans]AHD01345.1 3-deoxy-D-manno-octulosonic acid transferase [Leisingera methylohalidivorans DSM 14336]